VIITSNPITATTEIALRAPIGKLGLVTTGGMNTAKTAGGKATVRKCQDHGGKTFQGLEELLT